MTSYDITEEVNKISEGDTSRLETILPPNYCRGSLNCVRENNWSQLNDITK